MSTSALASIGVIAVAVIAYAFNWAVRSAERQTNIRWDQKEAADREFRKEQIEDAYQQMKGMEILSNGLSVMMRHMITGDHIEDLERAQQQLEAYQAENNDRMMHKAAKYNLR